MPVPQQDDDAAIAELAGNSQPIAPHAASAPRYASDEDAIKSLIEEHFTPQGAAPAPTASTAHAPTAHAPTPDDADYENMSLGHAAYLGMGNLGHSAYGKAQALGHAIANPSETLSALGQVGTGLYSKAKGMFVEQDKDQKAKDEAIVNAIGEHYGDTYGSMAGFKKTLATDPFDIGMDVASLVPGVGVAGRAAGLTADAAGIAGKIAQAGSIAGKAASMLDPIQAGLTAGSTVGGLGLKAADALLTGAQATASGVPKTLLKVARSAGATNDAESAAAYSKFSRGHGSVSDIANTAEAAVDELKHNATQSYLSDKANLAKSQVQLPMNEIQKKLDELNQFSGYGSNSGRFSGQMHAVDDVNNQIKATLYSQDPNARTMIDLDNLKQSLQETASALPNNSRFQGKISEIANAVRDTIANHDTTYAKMMDDWSNWKGQLANYKGFGVNAKAADSANLAKMMRRIKAGDTDLLTTLSNTQAGKTLPYMLAGHAVNPWLANGFQHLQYFPELAGALMYPAALPHLAGLVAASSPKIAGATQYAVGKAGKYLAPVGTAIDYATSAPVTYAGTHLGQVEQQQADGGRIGRKAGGRASNSAKAKADQLIAMADRIKKDEGKGTEPLLNVDDTTIAKALEIANRGI